MNVETKGCHTPVNCVLHFCPSCKRDKAVCSKGRGRCRGEPGVPYGTVTIPDDRWFLKQWFAWICGKVRKRFKRDHDRIPDTTQRVCTRLLQKEFTARWFYKHLHEDLVTRTEAEYMLGHGHKYDTPRTKKGKVITHRFVQLVLVSEKVIGPAVGLKTDPNSLWRVSDVLAFGKFDFERYFYSMQSHTIDSDRMLRLLGHAPGEYWKLQSLWRQDKILPAELTEHECPRGRPSREGDRTGNKPPPSTCPECSRGLALLRSKGISLAQSPETPGWKHPRGPNGEEYDVLNPALTPAMVEHIRKMRWNDSQLADFLRRCQGKNMVYHQPRAIVRPISPDGKLHGIDAGLLKYADRIVENEVINDFKHLGRTDDMTRMVYNNGVSPETSDSDVVAYDTDSEEGSQQVVCDPDAAMEFRVVEHRSDITSLLGEAALSDEESDVVSAIDLFEMSVRDYSKREGVPVQRVHRIRASALRKLRAARVGSFYADRVMVEVCGRHGCTPEQICEEVLKACRRVPRSWTQSTSRTCRPSP